MSQKRNACIVSIGACKFISNTTDIIDTFKVNIDPKSCLAHGLHIGKDSVKWWSEQPKETRQAWQSNPVSLEVGLSSFVQWYGIDTRKVWAKGICFDIPILENALEAVGMKEPWKYYEVCDYRTVLKILSIKDISLKSADSVYHDALSDSVEQAKMLMPLLQAFEEFEHF